MCGIMGYMGDREAAAILLSGLKALEYRGYDSAGIAVYQKGEIHVERAKGKLAVLDQRMKERRLTGTPGIGHTRWATHGKPSDENAHPHRSSHVVVVHNGIIENHMVLRERLLRAGAKLESETDTEIVPHLIESYLEKYEFVEAVRLAIAELKGAFAFAIMSSLKPDQIIAAKNASPLILGIGKNENFIASDIPALLEHTRDVVILEDGEMAVIQKDRWEITDFQGKPVTRSPKQINWSRGTAEKEGYKHFMLKEIHEQPRAIADTLRGRVIETTGDIVLDDVALTTAELSKFSRVVLVACGTSWHAALVGKFWMEALTHLPTEVDLASEFRYRNPRIDPSVLVVPISQSGETADTLAALEEAKTRGGRTLAICNVVDSSIARKAHDVLYTHAGPEIGVASTKAFTTQLTALAMLALFIGKGRKTLSRESLRDHLHELIRLPVMVEECLKEEEHIAEIATRYSTARDFLFLGRGSSFPIALEGALKLKEISYIHAEGYPGGEIKHGPIALIDETMPVVALVSGGAAYVKMLSNIQEVLARGGKIIAVARRGDSEVERLAADRIPIPDGGDFIRPILEVIPLQLLAYHIAERLETDIDQPRNLAKSVTVE